MISIWRIWAIASNGFREVIRDRVLYLVGLFTLVLALAWRIIPQVAAGTDEKILLDLGIGAIGLLSVIVAVFVGTGLINKEIEKRTVLVLIPKPISSAEFIIGKHLGLTAVLSVLVAMMTAVYFVLLFWTQIEFPVETLLVSVLYLLLELGLLVAVAILFGVFTSSLLATLLAFGVYLMGHLSQDLLELGKISESEALQSFTKGLYLVLPDLSRLNLRNEAVYGLLPEPTVLLSHAVYAILYMILILTIATFVFSRRQF
jgi:ABC-type transport system involved in multi-copper enzyme maturation permease subunit